MLLTTNRHAKHQEDVRRLAEEHRQKKQWSEQHKLFEKKPILQHSVYNDHAAHVDVKQVMEQHNKKPHAPVTRPVAANPELKNIIQAHKAKHGGSTAKDTSKDALNKTKGAGSPDKERGLLPNVALNMDVDAKGKKKGKSDGDHHHKTGSKPGHAPQSSQDSKSGEKTSQSKKKNEPLLVKQASQDSKSSPKKKASKK